MIIKRFTYIGISFIIIEICLLFIILFLNDPILVPPLTLLIILHILSTYPQTKLNIAIKREVEPSIIFAGDEVNVKLTLYNKGPAIPIIFIDENIDIKLRENYTLSISLNSGEKREINYKFYARHRGKYSIGPLKIRVFDRLMLTYSEYIYPEKEVLILPRYESAGFGEARSTVSGVWPGGFLSRRRGDSIEFKSVREYVEGDILRRVNWRLTAKYDKIMINEFESEKIAEILLVMDVGGLTAQDEHILNSMVDLAASITYSLVKLGNRVGLINHGGERRWLPPGYGKVHLIKIFEALALTLPKYEIPLSIIVERLPRLMTSPGAIILLITPLLSMDTIKSIAILKSEGYKVSVICPIDAEYNKWDLSSRIRNLERINNLLFASKVARVIPYNKNASIKMVLEAALR